MKRNNRSGAAEAAFEVVLPREVESGTKTSLVAFPSPIIVQQVTVNSVRTVMWTTEADRPPCRTNGGFPLNVTMNSLMASTP
jgi:hypothetical protein